MPLTFGNNASLIFLKINNSYLTKINVNYPGLFPSRGCQRCEVQRIQLSEGNRSLYDVNCVIMNIDIFYE